MFAFLVQILVAVAINIVAYMILPKKKPTRNPAAQDFEDPTAEAGRPIPVAFGTITIKGVNILWFGDKEKVRRKVNP